MFYSNFLTREGFEIERFFEGEFPQSIFFGEFELFLLLVWLFFLFDESSFDDGLAEDFIRIGLGFGWTEKNDILIERKLSELINEIEMELFGPFDFVIEVLEVAFLFSEDKACRQEAHSSYHN